MARLASGEQHVVAARALLKNAKTADELRLAQAVLLPLELGLSLEQTAACIGRSVGATCSMRTRFGKVAEGKISAPRSKKTLRNRAHADLEQEALALDAVMVEANAGGIVVIPRIKKSLEAQLGKTLALSTVYRMLERHGWRKLAPDTRHPQGNPPAREEWKKNCAPTWVKSPQPSNRTDP